MVERDTTQTTWERPSSGSDYTSFCAFVDKLEMDLHNAMRVDLKNRRDTTYEKVDE